MKTEKQYIIDGNEMTLEEGVEYLQGKKPTNEQRKFAIEYLNLRCKIQKEEPKLKPVYVKEGGGGIGGFWGIF